MHIRKTGEKSIYSFEIIPGNLALRSLERNYFGNIHHMIQCYKVLGNDSAILSRVKLFSGH